MTDVRGEYCPICNDRFKNKEKMLRHFERHSAEEKKLLSMADDRGEYCPICNDRFNSQEEMIRHFESHSTEEKMKVLKYGSAKQENQEPIASRKPSLLWYLAPLLLGIVGGLIGYVDVKKDDKKMADNLLEIGIFMTTVSVVYIWFYYIWLTSHI
jgi:hypothetical protein